MLDHPELSRRGLESIIAVPVKEEVLGFLFPDSRLLRFDKSKIHEGLIRNARE